MSVQALIQKANEAGVELRVVDGRVKAIGTRSAVARMLDDLRLHRAELIETMTATPADWRALSKIYQQHHWTCETCIAGGQGRGLRCGVGTALWRIYSE